MNIKRLQLATYLMLGFSAMFPLFFVAYSFFRYGFYHLLGFPQSTISIAFILFVVSPYGVAIWATALLPKEKRPLITMLIGSLLVSAVSWLSMLLCVWRHFWFSPHHDMEVLGWTVRASPYFQWPIILSAIGIAYLLCGNTYKKQAIRMFVGLAIILAIFFLPAMFYPHNSVIMACSWWLGFLVVVVLLFSIIHVKSP